MSIPVERVEIYKHIPKPIDEPFGGPEGIVCANDGSIYVGSGDGWIYRISEEGQVEPFANTGGRPLGIAIDRQDALSVKFGMYQKASPYITNCEGEVRNNL